MRELLSHGADPNVKDMEGMTPLHTLMTSFDKDYVRSGAICQILIFGFAAKPNVRNNDLLCPLHLAACKG